MKFCPVVPEICHGQAQVPKKERRKRRKRIIIRNRAKTISLPNNCQDHTCIKHSYTNNTKETGNLYNRTKNRLQTNLFAHLLQMEMTIQTCVNLTKC